jgi:UPF0755 protein
VTFIGNLFKAAVGLAMLAGVIIAAVFIWNATGNISFSSGDSTTTSNRQPVMFTVNPGDSVSTIADNLKKEGIIDSPFWFRTQLKLKGADGSLKAGRFQLTPGMELDKLIQVLSTSPAEVGIRFTVIEGMRIGEMADKLASEGIADAAKFNQLAGTAEGSAAFQDDFLLASGKPADQGLEGYLFPDTYEIKQSEGDNSEAVIRKMLSTMEEKFTPEMRKQIADRQLTIHQVLTVASIVQREGRVKEELPTIAAVFWNRVNEGMRLDADPTTQFAVGTSGKWWPNLDDIGVLPGTVEHPYNTYTITGLPPGPICSPGLASIEAAVYPAQTDYLYFVAKNDGTGAHAFASTLEDHERNRVTYGNR